MHNSGTRYQIKEPEKDTWEDVSEKAVLESLAIRQTDDVFHEVEELLAATKQVFESQRPKRQPDEPDPFE